MKTQSVQLNFLMIAPRKVRLITDTLKGMSVQEAEAQLLMRPQRSAQPLLKLLRSAVANAKTNAQMNGDNLKIEKIIVNPGPVLKRSLPRSMGRATPLLKRMSHVTIVVAETEKPLKNRFVIAAPEKKSKSKKAESKLPKGEKVKGDVQPKPEHKIAGKEERGVSKPKNEKGMFKRFFNRKSI